ncbi:MAG: hypothetical protein ACK4SW_06930 [Sulfurihydrogenibium azorense]
MTTFDLLKIVLGIIVALIASFISYQINYTPLIDKESLWKKQLEDAKKIYEASMQVKKEYEKYQKLAADYEKLRQEVFPSKTEGEQVFMSSVLKKIENIVTEVRNNSKDKDFKLSNINFGAISNRNIGAKEDSEGIAVRSTEITMSISGKYSTIVIFLREISDVNKMGGLVRVKTISFSPSSKEVGKSPVNNVSLTLEMIQIIR